MHFRLALPTHFLPLLFSLVFNAHAVVDGYEGQYITNANDWLIRQVTVKIFTNLEGRIVSCTGVQISKNQILTAGHCLTREMIEASYLGRMVVEAYDPAAPHRTRLLKVYSGLSEESPKGDIGILQITGELPGKMFFPLADGACDKGSEYLAAGFGINETNSDSRDLRMADLLRAPSDISELINSHERYSPSRLILVAKSGQPCNGDSGGPVFCRKRGHLVVAGIYGARTYNRDPSTIQAKGELCRQSSLYVVTSVTATMNSINKWRQGLARKRP